MRITSLAIDIAKEKFHLFGVDQNNKVAIDKAMGRKKLMSFLVNLEPLEIFMESCAGSNYLCQKFIEMGHKAYRIAPQHVKPFAQTQKNDRNDAKAILEASRRPGVQFVGIKASWQQDLQSLHKIRDSKMKRYKSICNQARGLLFEFGIIIPIGIKQFTKSIPLILEDAETNLSGVLREEISYLFEEFRYLQAEVKRLEKKIDQQCKSNEFYQAAQEELIGVGPLVASRFLSTIGTVGPFKSGRQVSAYLGLVPRQHSSGGKTQLGRITKNGDQGLRTMIIQGARAAIAGSAQKIYPNLDQEKIRKQVDKKGFNKAAVALANQNTRRMWAIMKKCS
jgi:transposase